MNKKHENYCKKSCAAKIFDNQFKTKPSKKLSLKLTYLEYLKERCAKELLVTKQLNALKNEETSILETTPQKVLSKRLENFQDRFEGIKNTKKALHLKEVNLLWKSKDNVLQNSELDEAKVEKLDDDFATTDSPLDETQPRKEGEDYMIDDFVIIEPEQEPEPPQADTKFRDNSIEFISRALAGAAQTVISQPLDTVKVKQQTFPKIYPNMFVCIGHTYRLHGIIGGLYSGTLVSAISKIAEFVTYDACQKYTVAIMDLEGVNELVALDHARAGSIAAFFSTFISCPLELIKCRLQAAEEIREYIKEGSKVTPMKSFKLARHIFENEGIYVEKEKKRMGNNT